MKFVILAVLLAVTAASYNNKAPANFGSLVYSNPANPEPNYQHTSVNTINSEPVYSTPATSTIAYSAVEVNKVSPISEPASAYATVEADANEDEEENEEEEEDDDDEDNETKSESESTDGKYNKDSGDTNVYATSAVGGEHGHTTSTHVVTSATSAYKEPEYSKASVPAVAVSIPAIPAVAVSTPAIPAVAVSTPAYQTPTATAVPVYEAQDKIVPYWLRSRNY